MWALEKQPDLVLSPGSVVEDGKRQIWGWQSGVDCGVVVLFLQSLSGCFDLRIRPGENRLFLLEKAFVFADGVLDSGEFGCSRGCRLLHLLAMEIPRGFTVRVFLFLF